MKKIFTFFAAIFAVVAMNAQTVDLALIGFLDGENQPLDAINLTLTDNLNPKVGLMNNGPDVVASGDTVFMDISFDGTILGASYLLGSMLQPLTAGQGGAIGGEQPLLTADQMDQLGLVDMSVEMCYTLRIVGTTTDPDASNDQVCIRVNRGNVGINNATEGEINVYPNPATDVINVANAEGAQISVFDMNGRRIANVENASANEMINSANFSKGLYIIRIVDGQNVTTKKVNVVR